MFSLPVRSMSFQAAVAVLAVFLCGFLVWTAAGDTVTSKAAAATPGATPDATPGGGEGQYEGSTSPPPPLASASGSPSAPPTKVSSAVQAKPGRTEPGKWVSLTFDDGPWNTYTDEILAILKQYNVKAVFCMVGNQARDLPSEVQKVVADGHTLCNHTMSHDEQLSKKSPDEVRGQMQHALDALAKASPGTPVPFYRAPGGGWSPLVQETAASLGMRSLGWSVDTEDWKKPGVDKAMATVSKQLGNSGIILMHDGGGDRTMSVDLLKKLVPQLIAEGYQFTIPA